MSLFSGTCRQFSEMIINEKIAIPQQISVAAIQGYGQSGTTLIHSLLDNHPDVLSIPFVYGIFIYPFWERWIQNQDPPVNIIDSFIEKFEYWFDEKKTGGRDGLDQMGPEMNEVVYAPREAFREAMRAMLPDERSITRGRFLAAVYASYASAIGRTIKYHMFINFPLHGWDVRYVRYLLEDFPNVKFIYMVRDPITVIGSSFKYNNTRPTLTRNCPWLVFNSLLNNKVRGGYLSKNDDSHVFNDRPYFPEMAEASRAVRLEDLHKRPEITMKSVAHWLEIPWDPCLLESTFDGKKWWNRPGFVRICGSDPKQADKKHYELFTEFDRLRIYALTSKRCRKWNYEIPSASRSFMFSVLNAVLILIPFRIERISLSEMFRPLRGRLRNLLHTSGRGLLSDCFEIASAASAGLLSLFIPITHYFMVRATLISVWAKNIFTNQPYIELLDLGPPPSNA